MYESFFNLTALPFENTANPRYFFASEQHREALAAIEYTIRMRKGIVLITGAIGSGKTTVGQTMCERCGDQATIVQILHGHREGIELLRHVLRSLGVAFEAHDEHALLLERLEAHLVEQYRRQRPIVLLVDEAQTLTDEALEELRLLTNFDTPTTKLIQLVLVGQPELRQRIAHPSMTPLRQRIVLAKHLHPLSPKDTVSYILHRLRSCSADPKHLHLGFTAEAVHQIYRWTQGVPRLINVVCDNCLLMAYVKQTRQVTQEMVRRVVQDMVATFEQADAVEPGVVKAPAASATRPAVRAAEPLQPRVMPVQPRVVRPAMPVSALGNR